MTLLVKISTAFEKQKQKTKKAICGGGGWVGGGGGGWCGRALGSASIQGPNGAHVEDLEERTIY